MNARRVALLVAAGRAAIGVAVLAAPEAVMSRWLGEDNASQAAVKDLGRGLAARDLGLALATWQTIDDPVAGSRVQAACAVADVADTVGTLLAWRALPAKGAAATVLVAGGSAALGFHLAHRLGHEI